ncbi:MAG: RlmE family RNA methyltransferase [Pseudomonadota bacterium]
MPQSAQHKAKRNSRFLSVELRNARKHKPSSQRWLRRQLNDVYVNKAREAGYRSRAAFKLIELHEKTNLFKKGQRILDLGAAPGSWSQVATQYIGNGQIVAVDLLEMDALASVNFLCMDFWDEDAPEKICRALKRQFPDLILSDMAPSTVGHKSTDHDRIMALSEAAFDFTKEILVSGGDFVVKIWQGRSEQEFMSNLRKHFKTVKLFKPAATRSDSSEMYVVAKGFMTDRR